MDEVNAELDRLAAGLRRKGSLTRTIHALHDALHDTLFSTETGGAGQRAWRGQSLARHTAEAPVGGGGRQAARRSLHSNAEASQPAAEASRPAAEGQGEAGLLA